MRVHLRAAFHLIAYYAIPVAIFILVAILLVICVTLWVVPYCVDHQRKRKKQTDAAKSANLYDDDDEISTGDTNTHTHKCTYMGRLGFWCDIQHSRTRNDVAWELT